jgi:small-conductance mechanosensitive channel
MNQPAQIIYQKFLVNFNKIFDNSSFYWQSVIICICLITAYLGYLLITSRIFPKIIEKSKNNEISDIVNHNLTPILYQILSIIHLVIALVIYRQFAENDLIFLITLKLITLFLFLKLLRLTADSSVIPNIVGFILLPAMVLDVFGAFKPISIYLDSYALEIGKFKISLYLFLKALIVLLIVFLLLNISRKKLKKILKNSNSLNLASQNITIKFIDIAFYLLLAIITLQTIGIDITTLAVLGGAIGVGIGLGLQKIASNFIGGIILLVEKSMEIGDLIEIENGKIFGTIKEFAGRYTIIESFDGKEVIVPNEDLITNKITNWTYSSNRARIEIKIGVSYNSNLKLVQQLMIEGARASNKCLKHPEAECYLEEFAEYDVKFILYFWIEDILQGRNVAKSEVLFNIWQLFAKHDVKIPLPQREITVFNQQLTS